MKYMKGFSMLFLLVTGTFACKTEMVEKFDELALETGGYMRTVTPFPVVAATFSASRANMAGTRMELVAEAVTPNAGDLFASYDLFIRFVDTTPANGTRTTAVLPLRVIPASAYAKDPTTGYPRLTLIVTGAEALTATQLTNADVLAGDRFEITGTMRLTNGRSFNAANTSVNITGGAFYSSPFFYRLNVVN